MQGILNFVFGSKTAKNDKQVASHKSKQASKKKRVTFDSIEDSTHLVCMVDYNMRNRRVGAYLLKKNDSYQFVFGFITDGYHPNLSPDELEVAFDKLENGLKDFPLDESLQIHYQDFRSVGSRISELDKLWESSQNENIQLILKSQQHRDKELAKHGKRREKKIILYCTFTVNMKQAEVVYDNWIEKILAWLYGVYEKVAGERKTEHEKFSKIVKSAFVNGYLRWENFLSTTVGLEIKPLRHENLWELLWKRFNKSKPIAVPQVIQVTQEGVTELLKSVTHPVTLLVAEREPVADELWVNVKGKYVAPLTLVEKPGGWPDKASQLKYLWNTLLSKERLYDIEIFAELKRANDSLVQESVRRLLAQSLTSNAMAMEAGTIDVAAQLKTEKAIEAQAEILEGSVPFWLGFVVLVHRDNLDDLDETCKYIESCFLRPTWVERERFISWQIWLQTLPIYWGSLLVTNISNRRHLFLHSEVMGLMPLVKPQDIDRGGLQLLTEEGGYPIFIDLYNEPKHMMVLATTRAGKSVMITYPFIDFLARGMGVIIIDYPRMDGTSTFTDLTHLLGGSYIDIARESQNCMEIPDFSHLPRDKAQVFFDDYKSFVKNLYFTIVMGTNSVNHVTKLGTQVRSILDIAVEEFFADPEILRRYEQGKQVPDLIPTGYDFIPFTKPEKLKFENVSDMREAFSYIELRLTQFFASIVGKAIMSKSTVKPENQLTVYAFTNVNNDEDAAILSVVALTAALRNSLRYPRSIFFIDEAPILFEFSVISDLIGRLCANGAKAGISVILSAQDPNTVVNASSGSKIVQNMGVTLVGRIKEVAVDSFVKYLQYDKQLISRNASKGFFPKKSEIYSQWLVDCNGYKTYCRFYPGILQLALVANNPDEQKLRDTILSQYDNKYDGYKALCQRFLSKLRN
jgi:hypothetical protein